MKKPVKFSPEVREGAVRLLGECRASHPSQWAAIESIAGKIGCSAAPLHTWVSRHEIDTGQRPGVTLPRRSASSNANARAGSCAVPTSY